jgi:uncharacterized Zn-finger protein
MLTENSPPPDTDDGLSIPPPIQPPQSRSGAASVEVWGSGYPKFRNDRGVPEICIGVREFECIGVSPPQDHPHIYIDMAEADTILCPYCVTRFRFDPRLTPLGADPPDSFFANRNAA